MDKYERRFSRPSPFRSAKFFKTGQKKLGQDKTYWYVKKDTKGVKRWARVKKTTVKSRSRKQKKDGVCVYNFQHLGIGKLVRETDDIKKEKKILEKNVDNTNVSCARTKAKAQEKYSKSIKRSAQKRKSKRKQPVKKSKRKSPKKSKSRKSPVEKKTSK